MTKLRSIRFLASIICLLQLAWPNMLMACPTCKDGLHDDGTAAAYAISILLMLAMPFVILSFWVATIIRLRSKLGHSEVLNAEN